MYLHSKELDRFILIYIYIYTVHACFTHLEGFYDQTTRRSESSHWFPLRFGKVYDCFIG